MASPKVTAITINYNQTDYTFECIKSLISSNYKNFEIIIIDNGSEQDNYLALKNRLESIETERLHCIRLDQNIGYVRGINYGLEKAKNLNPNYILILNNDTVIDISSISNLVTVAEKHNGRAIVSGKVYHYDTKNILQYIGQYPDNNSGLNHLAVVKNQYEKDLGQYDSEMEMGMLDDIYWLMPISLYDSIGGYSDYFYLYGEQNDYALRAISAGFKLIYTPQAKLWHKGGITTSGGNKKSARIEYWKKMAILKLSVLHLSEDLARSFFWKWLFRESIKTIVFFLIRKKSFSNLKAHFLAISHFKHWKTVKYKDVGFNPFD